MNKKLNKTEPVIRASIFGGYIENERSHIQKQTTQLVSHRNLTEVGKENIMQNQLQDNFV